MDSPPVLDSTEHVFDFVTLSVERGVIFDRCLAVRFWRDSGFYAVSGQSGAGPVAVLALVAAGGFWRGRLDGDLVWLAEGFAEGVVVSVFGVGGFCSPG